MEEKREYTRSGIRKETWDLLFKTENIQEEYDNDSKLYNAILHQIEKFTLDESLVSDEELKSITYDEEKKMYNFNLDNTVIPFKKLSDVIGDEFPKMKKELLSKKD